MLLKTEKLPFREVLIKCYIVSGNILPVQPISPSPTFQMNLLHEAYNTGLLLFAC